MNSIHRDIFKAIHEGKWLKIEYLNKEGRHTNYWIGIRDLDPRNKTLKVDGLHLNRCSIEGYDKIYIDSILSTEIVEGSYCPENERLIEDIALHPERYQNLFANTANLKILNYLEMCSKLDATPYTTDYELVRYIDGDQVRDGEYQLSEEQFKEIVTNFQRRMNRGTQQGKTLHIQKLALNILSIHTKNGLYVLAYRNLNLDVKNKAFKPDEDITICTQFTIGGEQENIRRYLDADEYELLSDFEKNLEKIKDAITEKNGARAVVDDMPYVIGLGMDCALNLHEEYKAILDMYEKEQVTFPIRAFSAIFWNVREERRHIRSHC